jgi:hypothetical protein
MRRGGAFHPMAAPEFTAAVSYSNAHSPGLGTAVLDEVQRAVEQLLEPPEAAPRVNRRVRRTLGPRYPYGVRYALTADRSRMLAMAKLKRRPFYWRGRE